MLQYDIFFPALVNTAKFMKLFPSLTHSTLLPQIANISLHPSIVKNAMLVSSFQCSSQKSHMNK